MVWCLQTRSQTIGIGGWELVPPNCHLQVDETRQRLRSKLLERQLSRGPGAKAGPERKALLVEMAQLQQKNGKQKAAMQSLR